MLRIIRRFGRWLIVGESVPRAPAWLFHMAGNFALIGFYTPAIAFCIFLAMR